MTQETNERLPSYPVATPIPKDEEAKEPKLKELTEKQVLTDHHGREVLVCPYPAQVTEAEWDAYVRKDDRVIVVHVGKDKRACLCLSGGGHDLAVGMIRRHGYQAEVGSHTQLRTNNSKDFDTRNNFLTNINIANGHIMDAYEMEKFGQQVVQMVPESRRDAQVEVATLQCFSVVGTDDVTYKIQDLASRGEIIAFHKKEFPDLTAFPNHKPEQTVFIHFKLRLPGLAARFGADAYINNYLEE